ncbi:MAG: SDR family oxidoreductase [Deltaproteobacteria bacterium]|nr:SDR family oxidoreductase [Deltaproteobacteria bacterium]
MKRLAGKVVVVTGSTQGLGAAIALRCADAGALGVVITGRSQEKGRTVGAQLEQRGARAHFVRADLEKVDDCRRVIEEAHAQFGRIDGLVNSAATTDRGHLEDTSVELWDRTMALNVRAPFLLTQEAVRIMKREGNGGSIVNILSMSANGGQPFLCAYSTSKGALATLTKNNAHALRKDKIRVNGLRIGWMETPGEHAIQHKDGNPKNWLELAAPKQPFGRILSVDDVAGLTLWLLSPEGSMMTGSLIDFDQNVIGAYD